MVNLYLSKGHSNLRQVLMDLNESLSNMKRQFVSNVRELAMRHLRQHFMTLEMEIRALHKDNLQDELIDELQDRLGSIERLVFSLIRSHAFAKLAAKDDAQETLQSIQARIAKLVNGQQAVDTSTQTPEDSSPVEEFTTQIEKLGFMQRAPNTEIPPSLTRFRLFTEQVSKLPSHRFVLARQL
jgi:hypothetical protein